MLLSERQKIINLVSEEKMPHTGSNNEPRFRRA